MGNWTIEQLSYIGYWIMYKVSGQIDQKKFSEKLLSIVTMVNGYGEDFLAPEWKPQLTPELALDEIVRLYSEEYWISSFRASDERDIGLRELKSILSTEIVTTVCENLKIKSVKKDDDGKYVVKMVKAYDYKKKGDRANILKRIGELSFELPCEKLREEYLPKVDEKRFDELLDYVIGTLFKTENDDYAKKFIKLWMIDTKMKRFYLPDEKYPKNPIWLSLWSEKHSIGKGYFVNGLRKSFTELFNGKTKTIAFKDLSKQFKGFASSGAYICHADEADRVGKGESDPNSTKNLITEKNISVERKGVDNDEDYENRISYISTTNQSIKHRILKDMEEDRRLGEIHIVDACEEFKKCSFDPKEMRRICEEMWKVCPVVDDELAMEVRNILLGITRAMAITDFAERLEKLAEELDWGGLGTTCAFKMYDDRKMFKVKWNTEVKKSYDKLFQTIGGWTTFTEMAKNIGFLYTTWHDKKRGTMCYNLDFSKVANLVQSENDERGDE